MSFDNHHPNRKDWRTPWRPNGRIPARGCRNHGSCTWCSERRTRWRRHLRDLWLHELREAGYRA